jgi:hypothetical protein
MTFFSASQIHLHCSSTIPHWAEAWQHFVITVTAVIVLASIGRLPLLYNPKASHRVWYFLSEYSKNILGQDQEF